MDGGEKTALLNEVLNRFDHTPAKIVGWMDKATATDYATFAPLVLRHADQGDAAARQIVQAGAEQIDALVRRLIEYGARWSPFWRLSRPSGAWLSPDVRRRLKPADGDAVNGAIILAKRL